MMIINESKTMNLLQKITIAVIPVLLAGCSSDDSVVEQEPNNNTPSKQQVTFTASLEDAITTRTSTSFNSTDGWKTVWTSGDKIKISNGASNTADFEIPNASAIKNDGQEATFTLCDDETFTNGTGGFYAAYPADKVTLSGGTLTGNIPTSQKLSAATGINPDYQYMTAYTTDGNFTFKNIVSFFRINVTSSTDFPINVIKVVANDGTYLSGDFTATISTTGEPTSISVSSNSNASTFVELQSDAAMNGTYYLAVVAPKTSTALKMTLLLESNVGNSGSNVIEQKIYQRINTGLSFGYKNVYDLGTYDLSTNTKIQNKILSNVIDLGLPSGTIWATKNIAGTYNADSLFTKEIGDLGQYYAWAEDFGYGESWEINPNHTSTIRSASLSLGSDSWPQTNKTHYKWSTYKWCDGTSPNTLLGGTGANICKYKSGGLDIYDDVAYIKSGGKYCMPTSTQQIELMNSSYCDRSVAQNGTIDTYNGNKDKTGVKFTSTTYSQRSLWLPAAGAAYIDVGSIEKWGVGEKCQYWSRTLYSVNNGYCLDWPVMKNGNSSTKISYDARFSGRSIRAVVTNENIAPLVK